MNHRKSKLYALGILALFVLLVFTPALEARKVVKITTEYDAWNKVHVHTIYWDDGWAREYLFDLDWHVQAAHSFKWSSSGDDSIS